MKITYLKLVNYKRLPLRDTNTLEWRADQKLTMLSGPNGSGKSSLMDRLTPLPPNRKDFNEDGYQDIHIEHNKNLYELTADFRNGVKYSFVMNGEELNRAGIVTTQKLLVEKHFNITDITHDLIVGKETFTNMNINARKKLFNTITHLNIDEVISLYNQKKIELRDQQNLLKNTYALLKAEENKLLDESMKEDLQCVLNNTCSYLDYLTETTNGLKQLVVETDSQENLLEKYKTVMSQYQELADSYKVSLTSHDLEQISKKKQMFIDQRNRLTHILDTRYEEMEKLQRDIDMYGDTLEEDEFTLLERKKELETLIANRTTELKYIKEDSIKEQEQNLLVLESSLPEICSELPEDPLVNGVRVYGTAQGVLISEHVSELTEDINKRLSKILSIENSLKDMEHKNDNVTCPSCKHTWSPTNREEAIKHLQSEYAKLNEEHEKRKAILAKENETLTEHRRVYDLYRRYHQLKRSSYEVLKRVWNIIDEEELFFNKPSIIPSYIRDSLSELNTYKEKLAYQEELKYINAQLDKIERSKSESIASVRGRYESLERQVQDLNEERNQAIADISYMELMEEVKDKLTQFHWVFNNTKGQLRQANLNKVIESMIDGYLVELSLQRAKLIEVETELREQSSLQYMVDRYQATVDDIKKEIDVLKIITDELSPTNGLIAKSVSSFLNMIINNVNNTIKSIWGYKMELLPIDVNVDALNYKFKVNVEDTLIVEDISLASKGMSEIINLSFKLVLYKLLNISEPPLFLDELGSHLDSNHTDKIVWLINQLSMSEEYSQLFLVSHKDNFNFIRDIDTLSTI